MSAVAVVRLGDTSSHLGTIISASSVNLKANGIPVAVDQDLHSCPIPGHGITPVTSAITKTSGGRSLLRLGCVAGCGAVMVTGSPNVNAS